VPETLWMSCAVMAHDERAGFECLYSEVSGIRACHQSEWQRGREKYKHRILPELLSGT
jgi:hypothetical protein